MTELSDAAPAIAVVPYGTKITPCLARLKLGALSWPLGQPPRLAQGTIAQMGLQDHLIAYVSSQLLYMPRPGVRAKISVMVVEPEAVQRRNMMWLRLLWRRFFAVLSCNPSLIAAIPNGHRFVFGSTWIPDWRAVDTNKTRMLSLIASQKRTYEGHRLRHRVAGWIRTNRIEADILGRGYAPFEEKSDGLAPYRYSVIIENVREPGYVTEKLIDCMLCDTVPIYWGAQDIEQIFDGRGMMVCNSFDEIQAAIGAVSEADYTSRLEFVAKNKEKASGYADHERAAARIVETAAQRTQPTP